MMKPTQSVKPRHMNINDAQNGFTTGPGDMVPGEDKKKKKKDDSDDDALAVFSGNVFGGLGMVPGKMGGEAH